MLERTEELGLSGRLPIVVGGQQVALRTLNLDESETWQQQFADFDISIESPAASKRTSDAMLELVQAYDIDGTLGNNLRTRFTRRELYDALMQIAKAEMPFLEDAPLAAKAFGEALAGQLMVGQFQQANSTNGHSPTGTSTRRRSANGSRKKGS